MLQYQHRKFKHIVDVPEPADIIIAANAEAEAMARMGTIDAKRRAEAIGEHAKWQANRQRQTLARMDVSRKWIRYTGPAPDPTPAITAEPVRATEPEPKAEEPKPVKRTKAETAE